MGTCGPEWEQDRRSGDLWGVFGGLLVAFGASMASLGSSLAAWRRLGAAWRRLSAVLEPSFGRSLVETFGSFEAHFGHFVEAFWRLLATFYADLGELLEKS